MDPVRPDHFEVDVTTFLLITVPILLITIGYMVFVIYRANVEAKKDQDLVEPPSKLKGRSALAAAFAAGALTGGTFAIPAGPDHPGYVCTPTEEYIATGSGWCCTELDGGESLCQPCEPDAGVLDAGEFPITPFDAGGF